MDLTLLSESGLYKLIMRCDKPTARPFQDWVKSAEPRMVVMTHRVQSILGRRIASPLNRRKVMGRLSYAVARRLWENMRKGVGFEDDREFVIHALRHTCCTRLVSAGVDLRTVQKWMGHEDIHTTMRYAQFVPENMFNAAAALEPPKPPKPALQLV